MALALIGLLGIVLTAFVTIGLALWSSRRAAPGLYEQRILALNQDNLELYTAWDGCAKKLSAAEARITELERRLDAREGGHA